MMENMASMFSNCPSLTSLDLHGFNTSRVKDMSRMFAYCNQLEEIDLSSFDTQNVATMESMFCGCKNMKKIIMHPEISAHTNTNNMFDECAPDLHIQVPY